MAVSISKPAINLREELARLKAPAIIKPQRFQTFWFENLVTNGTFDTDTTGWTLFASPGSSQSVVSGRLRITIGGGDTNARSAQAITTIAGATYNYSVDGYQGTSDADPQFKIGTSSGLGDLVSINTGPSDGTYTGSFVATGTTTYVTVQNNNAGDGEYVEFDNISIYEADPSDDAPWYRMLLGWKPFQVFEDGSLIREGSTHDYEVIFDGHTYFVKPSVAPGASTETQIVGVAT